MTSENQASPFLRFTKMHGLGNDFMVVDGISQDVHLGHRLIRRWSDRHFGIGFDQLLLVEPPDRPDVDFRYRIFNADGSEVEHCGNGARCFARFVREKGLIHKDIIRVSVKKGVIELRISENGDVTVDMGSPWLNPADIPFTAERREIVYPLSLKNGSVDISAISMGNPHAVMLVEDINTAPVHLLGPEIEQHGRFSQRCNAGFLQVVSRTEGHLRVFERGAGETMACGTGACAAMVAGYLRGVFSEEVTLHLSGGDIRISWAGEGTSVLMTGPATTVYEGQVSWKSA